MPVTAVSAAAYAKTRRSGATGTTSGGKPDGMCESEIDQRS